MENIGDRDRGTELVIDLDLCVGDRVEVISRTDNDRWATITSHDDATDKWLVIDNQGQIRQEDPTDIRRATRTPTRLVTREVLVLPLPEVIFPTRPPIRHSDHPDHMLWYQAH